MAKEQSPGSIKIRRWKTEEVFRLLKEPFRLQVLRLLARGEAKTAMELNAASGRRRHAYHKHMRTMCKAGILVTKENPVDRRQPLLTLAPGIVLSTTEDGITMDFGCCMLRISQ